MKANIGEAVNYNDECYRSPTNHRLFIYFPFVSTKRDDVFLQNPV
jgi:hypothetical protein